MEAAVTQDMLLLYSNSLTRHINIPDAIYIFCDFDIKLPLADTFPIRDLWKLKYTYDYDYRVM